MYAHRRGITRNDKPQMSSERVSQGVGEAKVVRNENGASLLGQLENDCVGRTAELEVDEVIPLVAGLSKKSAQRSREVFINEEAGHQSRARTVSSSRSFAA